MLLECINTSVWNLFIIPEEDWSQSKSIEEYEVNKLKNEDGYSCFYAFVQLNIISLAEIICLFLWTVNEESLPTFQSFLFADRLRSGAGTSCYAFGRVD